MHLVLLADERGHGPGGKTICGRTVAEVSTEAMIYGKPIPPTVDCEECLSGAPSHEPSPQTIRDDMRRALLRGDPELHRLYHSSAEFRMTIDMLIASAPHLVDAMAVAAREQARIHKLLAERLERAPLLGPWMVPTLDAEEPRRP